MADIKESALAQKNDFGYVRALDSNGNSIKINKADLVKVINSQLPVASPNTKGVLPNNLLLTKSMNADENAIYELVLTNSGINHVMGVFIQGYYQGNFTLIIQGTSMNGFKPVITVLDGFGYQEPKIEFYYDNSKLYIRTPFASSLTFTAFTNSNTHFLLYDLKKSGVSVSSLTKVTSFRKCSTLYSGEFTSTDADYIKTSGTFRITNPDIAHLPGRFYGILEHMNTEANGMKYQRFISSDNNVYTRVWSNTKGWSTWKSLS